MRWWLKRAFREDEVEGVEESEESEVEVEGVEENEESEDEDEDERPSGERETRWKREVSHEGVSRRCLFRAGWESGSKSVMAVESRLLPLNVLWVYPIPPRVEKHVVDTLPIDDRWPLHLCETSDRIHPLQLIRVDSNQCRRRFQDILVDR